MRSSYKGNPAESDMQGPCSTILKDREDDLETYPSNTFSANQFSTPIREPTTFKSS